MLGGLALFLYGLKSLSTGLQEVAGKKLNRVLEILTSVPVIGMLVGAVITIIVQSSTLTTVMVVSFVNSAILNLKQAAAVIMGANIGTTFTGHLIAFSITDFWIYFAALGFVVLFFAKVKNIKIVGQILFAFAMLLLGLALMSDAMRPLRTDPAFQNLIVQFGENRFLGVLAGLVFTAIVQSSTAVTGVIILMTLEGLIELRAALALIVGANIGTCFTAVLASIGGTTTAKRAAAVHVILNVFGAVIVLIFMGTFENAVLFISPSYVPAYETACTCVEGYTRSYCLYAQERHRVVARQAANAHTIFSAIIVFVFLPLITPFVKFVEKIIPERKTAGASSDTRFLDWKLTNSPMVAINLAQKELLNMADWAGQNIRLSIEGLLERDKQKLKLLKQQEKLVDRLEKEIVRYLATVSQMPLGRGMSIRHAGLLHAANDIERISDHARNIARSAKHLIDNDLSFPEDALEEINDMFKPLVEIYDNAVRSVRKNSPIIAMQVKELKMQIDANEKNMRAKHMTRMETGNITAADGIIYLEILSNLERIGDHSVNISHLARGKL